MRIVFLDRSKARKQVGGRLGEVGGRRVWIFWISDGLVMKKWVVKWF